MNEKSHKLSHLAVHIVSQLQVVANYNSYQESCRKFSKDQKNILIFGIKNTTLVGLMGLLLQLKHTSSQSYNMRTQRIRSFVTADPLLTADEYRYCCTRYLEIEVTRVLVRHVQKFYEFGWEVANGTIELSELWNSDSFRILVSDSLANVAMLSNTLFVT